MTQVLIPKSACQQKVKALNIILPSLQKLREMATRNSDGLYQLGCQA